MRSKHSSPSGRLLGHLFGLQVGRSHRFRRCCSSSWPCALPGVDRLARSALSRTGRRTPFVQQRAKRAAPCACSSSSVRRAVAVPHPACKGQGALAGRGDLQVQLFRSQVASAVLRPATPEQRQAQPTRAVIIKVGFHFGIVLVFSTSRRPVWPSMQVNTQPAITSVAPGAATFFCRTAPWTQRSLRPFQFTTHSVQTKTAKEPPCPTPIQCRARQSRPVTERDTKERHVGAAFAGAAELRRRPYVHWVPKGSWILPCVSRKSLSGPPRGLMALLSDNSCLSGILLAADPDLQLC